MLVLLHSNELNHHVASFVDLSVIKSGVFLLIWFIFSIVSLALNKEIN